MAFNKQIWPKTVATTLTSFLCIFSFSTLRAATSTGVRDILLSPDGFFLASADRSAIHVWDIRKSQKIATFRASRETVTSMAFSQDGHWLISISSDKLHFWNMSTGQEEYPLGREIAARTAVLSAAGDTLAVAHAEGVSIWDMAARRETFRIPPKSGAITALEFVDRDKLLAIGSSDRVVRIWDISARRYYAEFVPPRARPF